MSPVLMTAYVLAGPVVVAGVLIVLLTAYIREARDARRAGRSMI